MDGNGDEAGETLVRVADMVEWVDDPALKRRSFDERLFLHGMAWHRRALRITPEGLYCRKAVDRYILLIWSYYTAY